VKDSRRPEQRTRWGNQMSVQRISRRDALKASVVAMLVGAPLVSCADASNAPAPAPAGKSISAYTLGPGDKLRITVFGHEDLSGEFDVDGAGEISLPLIRNVKAQGLTPAQLEQVIAERLSPEYLVNPSVSVEVLNYRPFYIYGEVTKPGSYPYVNGMTVVNAVALAGGFTYRARTGRVRIIHANDPSRTPVDAEKDTPVLPGDVIEVPERYF
jgi:protein involved in polysaccharide export with SLBB domain